MPSHERAQTASAVANLMPNIIQGAHLGVLSSRMVTQSQFLILLRVHARGACAMSLLAKHMKVSLPAMSGMVDRLARESYIKRVDNDADRRQVMIQLTPKGQKFLNAFKGIITKRWEEVLKVLSESEVKAFHRVIVKLNENLKLRE